MKRKRKLNYLSYFYIITSWVIIINLLTWYTMISIDMFLKSADIPLDAISSSLAKYFSSSFQYLEATLFGIFFGLFSILADEFTEKTSIRKKSFGKIIIFKSAFYILGLFLTSIFIFFIFKLFDLYPEQLTVNELLKIVSVEFFVVMFLFILIIIFMMNFIIQVNKKFGPGNLRKMITGKYHQPIEEERIFMFLDLNDSTTLTEQLGSSLYSRMLKNCYYDLTDVVINYEAEIYQYVGDEVVLSWNVKKGLDKLNCLKTFFAFEKTLNEREEFYKKKFGFKPEFKAGMDLGKVTVTEIGEIKREIAFHGDPLNTASRILDQCKIMHKKLLISEHLENKLNGFGDFKKSYIGEVHLKGKKKNVNLFSIEYEK